MAKTPTVTIYLLKKGYDATNAHNIVHKPIPSASATRLPDAATLYLLMKQEPLPWWIGYFGIDDAVASQDVSSALLFLGVQDRCIAVSFGRGYTKLRAGTIENFFGLRTMLNRIEPSVLKKEGQTLESSRYLHREVTYASFEHDPSLLASYSARANMLFSSKHVKPTCPSSLKISSDLSFGELQQVCQELLESFNSSAFESYFANLGNARQVQKQACIEKLDIMLSTALRNEDHKIELVIHEDLDTNINFRVGFSHSARLKWYSSADTQTLYKYCKENNYIFSDVNASNIKRLFVHLGTKAKKISRKPLYEHLYYATALEDCKGNEFHFISGMWYCVDRNYINRIRTELDNFYMDLALPVFYHDSENEYNRHVEKSDIGVLCLDGTNIAPDGESQVEPCDLISFDKGVLVMYHVKRNTLSQSLSHLFTQGRVSLQLLLNHPEAAPKLCTVVRRASLQKQAEHKNFALAIKENAKYMVVFAIITHKDKNQKSKNLPLLSLPMLLSAISELKDLCTKACFGFISDKSHK